MPDDLILEAILTAPAEKQKGPIVATPTGEEIGLGRVWEVRFEPTGMYLLRAVDEQVDGVLDKFAEFYENRISGASDDDLKDIQRGIEAARAELSSKQSALWPLETIVDAELHRRQNGDRSDSAVIAKSAAKQYTFGPLYIPDLVDAHGHHINSDELQDGIWRMVRKDNRDIHRQHTDEVIGERLEIAVWPDEYTAEMYVPGEGTRDVTFPAGTPYMGVQWSDDAWGAVASGDLLGYSMAGVAQFASLAA